MATAPAVEQHGRTSSVDLLPPNMSELRLVLLGNSWTQRRDVGNAILQSKVFDTEQLHCCVRVRGRCMWKETVLVNTPDLLHPNMPEDKMAEHVENCVRLSDPGPHVFLLVLQPEDFTEQQRVRLQTVLENCGDRSFEHSLVLISPPTKGNTSLPKAFVEPPELKQLIRMCRFRYIKQENLELLELLTRCGQIIRENSGAHVSCDLSGNVEAKIDQLQTHHVPANFSRVRAAASGLRIVMFGKCEEEKTTLGNFIMEKKSFHSETMSFTKQCKAVQGLWKENPVTLVKTPDVFSLSVEEVRDELRSCVSLCSPGPNVLLLLVKPSDFTEDNRKTLKFILSLFGGDVFHHSLVISTHTHNLDETSVSVNKLLQECDGKLYNMFMNDHRLLMEKMEKIFCGNKEAFLSFTEETRQHKRASLNLVVFRRGEGRNSVAKAILGQMEFVSVSSSSDCVRHQGEVCGRWLSLVELPALSGKAQEAVMEESFSCVSLCEPEGVHAFIMVLPVGPLTDEDKEEFQTIQNTFSSRVKDFIMILFTVDSDPVPAAADFIQGDKDIQELRQSCGGRYVVLNIKDKQQIPELLEAVEKNIQANNKPGFTTKTLSMGKMEEEMKRHREELEQRHEKEKEEMKRIMKEQRAEIEKERQQKAVELKKIEESLKEERELRKKD